MIYPNRQLSISLNDRYTIEIKEVSTHSQPDIANKGNSKDIADVVRWKIGETNWILSKKTLIMGVLNVTPDSFSDGQKYLGKDEALEKAYEMEEDGADIIDVGGESTRPGSKPVEVEEELRRTIPVIKSLSKKLSIPISIDTTKAKIAEAALDSGAEIINDISAMRFDQEMVTVASKQKASVIIMHMRDTPETMQRNTTYVNILSEIYRFLSERLSFLLKHGIEPERIAVDPGIGFGKGAEDNLKIIKEIDFLKSLGKPIVLGPSRKSFIGHVLGLDVPGRLEGTSATITAGVLGGAHIVRVHDVKEMRRVVDMADAIKNA